jgi:L-threonylcarbamoyladenylate synthase
MLHYHIFLFSKAPSLHFGEQRRERYGKKVLSLRADMEDFRDDIDMASGVLAAGGLILYPTDTIWGIGCDATDEAAVRRVYALKRRVDCKAMIVLADSMDRVEEYVKVAPEVAYGIVGAEGRPVTVVYPEGRNLAEGLLAEDGSVGIRVTKEVFSKMLCRTFGKPVVSTSANISGEPSPGLFRDISEEIKAGVDYVVRYGRDDTTVRKASSIVRVEVNNTVKIIRE